MALKTSRFLQCHIEDADGEKVQISVREIHGFVRYGEVSREQLQANLLQVEVLKERKFTALVSWPVKCYCLAEDCLGDEFWIDKKFLI